MIYGRSPLPLPAVLPGRGVQEFCDSRLVVRAQGEQVDAAFGPDAPFEAQGKLKATPLQRPDAEVNLPAAGRLAATRTPAGRPPLRKD